MMALRCIILFELRAEINLVLKHSIPSIPDLQSKIRGQLQYIIRQSFHR